MTAQEPHDIVIQRWASKTMVGLDFETSGTNVDEDRIVTGTVAICHPGQPPIVKTWIVDPGIPIPEEAAAIHGWSTERIKAFIGTTTPEKALPEIASAVAAHLERRTPVVVMNAPFDFTMLERELTRHGQPSLAGRTTHGHGIAPVIDPRCLDKHLDPYRKGICGCGCGAMDKTLTGLCKHYGVTLSEEDAHTSAGDAVAAVALVPAIIARYPGRLSGYTVEGLHEAQIVWWRNAQISFEHWNQTKNGGAYTDIRPEWPVYPPPTPNDPRLQGALL